MHCHILIYLCDNSLLTIILCNTLSDFLSRNIFSIHVQKSDHLVLGFLQYFLFKLAVCFKQSDAELWAFCMRWIRLTDHSFGKHYVLVIFLTFLSIRMLSWTVNDPLLGWITGWFSFSKLLCFSSSQQIYIQPYDLAQ